MTIPNTNISFSGIWNVINNATHNGSDPISLNALRGTNWASNPPINVPSGTGALSINTNFKAGSMPASTINATIFPTNSSTYDAAIDGYYEESRSGHLILASEISAAPYNLTSGTINSLSFRFSGWTRAAAQKPLQTVKLWHTDAITLNGMGPNFEAEMRLPAPEGSSAPDFTIDLPDRAAYVAVPLTTPFVWNGHQNIFIIWDNRGGYTGSGYGVGYGETSSRSGLNRVWGSDTNTRSGNLAEMQDGTPSTHGRFDMQFGNG